MKKILISIIVAASALYGASTFIAKTWYYIKVIRTTERILRAQNVPFTF